MSNVTPETPIQSVNYDVKSQHWLYLSVLVQGNINITKNVENVKRQELERPKVQTRQ